MTEPFATGHPVFSDPQAASAAQRDGAMAGWQAALRLGPQQAAAGTRGAFAVALRQAEGPVFMAVDRFAMHTLCFRVDGGRLQVGADAASVAPAAAAIDPQALFDYLYFHAIPSPRTTFAGVQRLPPGHQAVFEAGQLRLAPYWVPHFDVAGRASFGELRDRFRKLLAAAVASQLDGSKAACFLSGGTDSSTVAGMIGQVTGRPAATYSIGFEAQGYDEMAYARIAARHFGTEHHEYYVTPDDLVRSIADVAAFYDQPFGNSSVLPAYYCARMARDDGVTRILAGDGGDELFGGNSRYATQRVFGIYGHVPGVLRRGLLEPAFEHGALGRAPGLRKVGSYIRQAKVPLPDRLQSYNLLQRLGIDQVLAPGFLRSVDLDDPLRQQRSVWAGAQAGHDLDRNLAFDWRYTLAESDLPKVRGAAALAGVEVGFPMLDQDLVDFAAALPPGYKLRGLKLRWFFKEALRGFLPDAILTKKKQGFGLPFGVWATRHAGLQALARDALGSLGTRGLVRPQFLKSLLDERLPQHPGFYGEMVWILMMLEHWLRAHRADFSWSD